ncbi:hypothetical protein N7474_002076 [Penicillium riverlandense]|uniref:uncharacterized protein n=1 Tax=Penicillium riverlandense TaxID=1903569 RepID=UPI0025492260|nr:uncharacterized protein N7474_002076 [Penicillium riverlandense]KAJ5833765.1 hypothetical protein N7474_002076 [Penicillium riverlandense]
MSDPTASPPTLNPSRYTYRQLQLLRHGSTATPLRIIAHIDLDAFYAQCEMVRLGTPRDTPLAVRQWESLIAINYPARPFGITRMLSAAEARKLCPTIVLQHVATFREGEGGRWAYREDSFRNIKTDKVSLDPYRAESRKILQTMKDDLATWSENGHTKGLSASVEKASIDEVFIDLSPLVFGVLLQRYPELRASSQDENRDAELPRPPTTAVEWNEDCLIDLDSKETEEDDPDWDDIAMRIGSEIVRSVRKAVWEKLNYTCSAGVARNKMLAKLGSACNKPDKQTVVRNRAVQMFLAGYKFTQIRMLGGKLGDQIRTFFGTEQVSDLLNVPLDQLRAKLDDHTATWLYGTIRGEDRSEVNPRTQMKSMLSAKSFRPSINSIDQAEKWLRIFAADIYGRLVEDGVLENRRRPRVITLHHRLAAQSRSRQMPIPASNVIDEDLLFELAKTLMRQVVAEAQAWPCSNLSLSVGSFEDGVTKNKAIESFFLRGAQAKSLSHAGGPREADGLSDRPPEKRRKVGENNGIERFFAKPSHPSDDCATSPRGTPEPEQLDSTSTAEVPPLFPSEEGIEDSPTAQFTCHRCSQVIPEHERDEHEDWHFAKDLANQDREEARATQSQSQSQSRIATAPNARGRGSRGSRGKPEKGQRRLAFQ